MNEKSRKPNRLINEKSPYLLQHAYNPVDWHCWNEETFEKARKEDKPIFLSIGYSTCHWCHVMERESFEDPDVADIMNNVFINVKVDREERPDIDNIYMTVCQMMTGGGGWPLTIIMTPDKKPFFSGTYFPKENRFGRIGLVNLIKQIENAWKNKRDDIEKSGNQIVGYLLEINSNRKKHDIDESVFETAYASFESRFDNIYGGFGTSPKFPSPHNLMFLLRYWKRSGNNTALEMVEKTLTQMRLGGIFDHIGFGFHRYSTDREWLLPHFEKMLYDQALISLALVETYQATQNDKYKNYADETFAYVLRDMCSPDGGFYSAEDADSEGIEGKFYVWSEKEIDDLLQDNSDIFKYVFNIKKEGNFSEEATRTPTGTNIPHLKKSLLEYASELNISPENLLVKIDKCRTILFNERKNRIHPLKDDKILTDWNGLMIAALAKGGKVFQNKTYIKAAERSLNFIFDKLIDKSGKLIHRYRDGESSIEANADDYAFVIWGLIELYEATYKIDYLNKAMDFNEIFMKQFYDMERGGFYFTSKESEEHIARTKEIYDGAVPSANSVSLTNLLKLGSITADSNYRDIASKLSETFSDELVRQPTAYTQLLCGLDFAFGPTSEIIVVEGGNTSDKEDILKLLNKKFIPGKIVVFVTDENRKEIKKIAEYASSFTAINNKTTVYMCQNYNCNLPVTDVNEVEELLKT